MRLAAIFFAAFVLPRRIRLVVPVALVGLLSLISSGCTLGTSVPISFDGFCGLSHEQFAAMDEKTFVEWIQGKYGVSPSRRAERTENGKQVVPYEWTAGSIYGNAWFHDGRLAWLLLDDFPNGPTFGQTVGELGPPEKLYRYSTGWENTVYSIVLEYPTLGFSVGNSGTLLGSVKEVTLSENLRVNYTICYGPGSLEDVLREVLLASPAHLKRLMDWPGFGVSVPLEPVP